MKIHDCSKLRVCLSFSFPEYIFSLGRLFKSGEYIEKKINKYIEQCENHSGWFSEFFCEGRVVRVGEVWMTGLPRAMTDALGD